jgi:hypothetical protein
MSPIQEIEGTWEEVLNFLSTSLRERATEFSGKRVRLTLLEENPGIDSNAEEQEMQQEFAQWEAASDEDFLNFEATLLEGNL